MNNPRKRHCHVCGKPLTCDCYYAYYGLVKLDGCGHTYIEFDACSDCLNKVLVQDEELLESDSAVRYFGGCDELFTHSEMRHR